MEATSAENGRREVFAALVGAGRASYAQYRLENQTDGPLNTQTVTLTALNSVDGPREIVATAARSSVTLGPEGGQQLTVITREGWGCDESLRFTRRGSEVWPEMYVPVKKIVVHHTATTNDYSDGAAEVRAIHYYHAKTQRWGDIGYNLLIDNAGNVYEGRHGRGEDPATREIASSGVVAGHCLSHNYGSTGVSGVGNFVSTSPTDAMRASLVDALSFEGARNHLDPQSVSDFLRSDDVWHDSLATISGHSDSYATSCPGAVL